MPTVKGPVLGLLPGQKDSVRVDFREEEFVKQIEVHGIRLAWARGANCPCAPVNDQTTQPSMNCVICGGSGFLWFRPKDYVPPVDPQELDPLQQKILLDTKAVLIRGVVVGVKREEENPTNQLSPWVFGEYLITTRPENRIGYYDRLTGLDALLSYGQLVETPKDESRIIPTRYPVVCVNLLRSEAQEFAQDVDYKLLDTGEVEFLPTRLPAPETRLSIHYDHHPVVIVWNHLNAFRDSVRTFKVTNKQTTLGSHQPLPVRALAKLEFLMDNN